MGTMTVNIGDDTEQWFRAAVKEKLGEGKGKLGQAVDEALQKWAEDKETDKYVQEAIGLMKKGLYKLPKGYKFIREEAYEDD